MLMRCGLGILWAFRGAVFRESIKVPFADRAMLPNYTHHELCGGVCYTDSAEILEE